jgi:hypothetical protein
LVVVGGEVVVPHSLRRQLQHDDHEGAHEKAGVRLLVILVRTEVIDFMLLEFGILYGLL